MFDLTPLISQGKTATFTMLFKNLLPISIALLTIVLLFVLPKKSKKGIKITKLCFAFGLLAFFIFKVVFGIIRYTEISSTKTFNTSYLPKVLGLDVPMCLTIWTIVTLFVSAFSKKENRFCEFLEHSLLGVGLTYALVAMFKLEFMIDKYDNLYHALNIVSMIFMFSYVFVPLYLVRINELKPHFTKFWYIIAGYSIIMAIVMMFSVVNGANYSEMIYGTSLRNLGIKLELPWHLLVSTPAFILMCLAFYMIVVFVSNKLIKQEQNNKYIKKNEFFDLQAFAMKSICSMQSYFIIIIVAALSKKTVGSSLGFLCLIPLFMTIFSVLAANEMDKLALLNDETIFEKENKKSIKVKIFTMFGNILYSLFFLKQFKNEREAIEDRRIREKKKRLKELQRQLEEIEEANKNA